MITPKTYMWREVKAGIGDILTVLGWIIGLLIAAGLFCVAVTLLDWMIWPILIVIAFLAKCWWEAQLSYQADKEVIESKIKDAIFDMKRLPRYYSYTYNQEHPEEQDQMWEDYKKLTGEFIKLMEQYERSYGKDTSYEEYYELWHTTDKYVRDALNNKTF